MRQRIASDLAGLQKLGTTILGRLEAAGIHSLDDLRSLGARSRIFATVCVRGPATPRVLLPLFARRRASGHSLG
jgi:hypothetical protein